MTVTSMTRSAPVAVGRGAARRSGTDPAFLIAAALFLAVVIAEAAFIALAARGAFTIQIFKQRDGVFAGDAGQILKNRHGDSLAFRLFVGCEFGA